VSIELTRLGDAIVTVRPLMTLERALVPECLLIVVDHAYASFFRTLFPRALVNGVRSPDAITNLLSASSAIRKTKPHVAVSWSPALRNGVLTRLTNARVRAGYLGYRGSRTPFLERFCATSTADRTRSVLYHRENIELRPRKVLDVLGLRVADACGPKESISWSGRHEELNGLRTLVLHPFARWKYREWPRERILQFIDAMLGSSDCTVILIGEQSELPRLKGLRPAGHPPDRLRCMTPKDLSELADVVAGCAVFVGTDSGPIHLAALLGVPCVGLFGPAPPDLTAPLRAKGDCAYHPLDCSPCGQARCVRPDAPCMDSIPVEEVVNLVRRKRSGNPIQTSAA
jgi:ADP-heptose:LPS heptosyltransferase